MKKIINFFITLVIISMIGIKGVKAETVNVTQQFVDNVWSFHYRNGSVWTFGNLPYNYADGKLVYCIQPDARITTNTYNVYSEFTMSGYNDDVRKQMELISYYGYGYEGHDSLKYYMATQELLWLYSRDESIRWTTGNTDDTPEIDISYEKNEIQRLINTHNILPSFANSTVEVDAEEYIELEDSNNTLEKYNISAPEDLKYEVDGNKIKIYGTKVGNYTLNFQPKVNYNDKTYIYDDFSIRTQTLASFGKPELFDFNINIKVNPKAKININKTDENNENLVGVEFEIYDENHNLVESVTTSDNVTSTSDLKLGKYYVKEIKTLYGYEKDETEYEVTLNENGTNLVEENLNIVNKKIKCPITYITTSNEDKIDVTFNIYNKNNELVYSGETLNGIASIELEYGDYVIKEIGVMDGYILNEEEIEFSVNDISCSSTLNMDHKKVRMPITSKESNIIYIFIILLNLGSYVFIKKNN